MTVTVMLGLIALGMSITIVDVAVPHIKGAFGMSATQVQWLATGFLAATTITLLIAPWCMRAFGQRNTYAGLLIIFVAGSLVGGFASSMGAIVIARIIQGGMTGLIRPVALTALFQVFPPHKKGMATAMYGMSLGLPLTLASVVGGWLVENYSWSYVFFVMIPFAIAGIIMGLIYLPGREEKGAKPPLDWAGVISATIFIFLIIAAISNGQLWGWHSDEVIALIATSLVCFIFFIWWELRATTPLLDLSIFKYKEFIAGFLVLLLFGGAFYAIMYILPLITEDILDYNPITAGLVFLPSTLVLALLVPIVGKLTDSIPGHWMSIPCILISGWGVYRMATMDWNSSFMSVAISMVLLSVGMASVPALAITRAMDALPGKLKNFGAGATNVAVQLGGAFATAAAVVLVDRRTMVHSTQLTLGLNPENQMANEAIKHLSHHAYKVGNSPVYKNAAGKYFMSSIDALWATIYAYQDILLIMTAMVFLLAIPSFLLGRWGEKLRKANMQS